MCVVSMVYDYYAARTTPSQWITPPAGTGPYVQPVYNPVSEFKEIIKRLDELDKRLGQAECHDPAKAQWFRWIEQRVKELEESK